MNDKSGRPVRPGDIVVYGHAVGRSAGLQYGLVLGSHRPYNKLLDRYGDEVLDIWGVSSGWAGMKPARLSRRSRLEYGDRLLVVTPEQVPPDVMEVLRALAKEHFEVKVTITGGMA